jgi:hypothetical protein
MSVKSKRNGIFSLLAFCHFRVNLISAPHCLYSNGNTVRKRMGTVSFPGKIMSAFATNRKRKKTTIISYFQAIWPSYRPARLDLHDSRIVGLASARTPAAKYVYNFFY